MFVRRAMWAASAVFGAILGLHAPHEGDVFWHLALGRAVLRAGSRVVPEPYALVSLGEPKIVPEWLWGVLTYLVEEAGGFGALTWLTAALGAAAMWLTVAWIDLLFAEQAAASATATPSAKGGLGAWSGQLFLSALALVMVAARLRLRPELLALSLMLGFLMLSRRFARVEGSAQWRCSAGLFAIGVVWAQVHGSSVLSPALFLLGAGEGAVRAPEKRAPLLATLLLLVIAVLTCAHGLDVVPYVLDHGKGDAAAHMGDMMAGGFMNFHPLERPFGLALSLLTLTWFLALAISRPCASDVLLAGLGFALFATAVRFGTSMVLLGMPLSVSGFRALDRAREANGWGESRWLAALRWLGVGGAFATCVWLVVDFDRRHPLFDIGFSVSEFPRRGALVLAKGPAAIGVYTPVRAGALLGFLGDGKLRISIDSRIPLHFDDAEYGTHRDAERAPAALATYFRRFGIRAAVAPRESGLCTTLSENMRLVSVDASYATFVQGSGSALPGIAPCAADHIEAGCPDPAGLARSVRTLRAQLDDVYARWLEGIAKLECHQTSPADAVRELPTPRQLVDIRPAVARWRVRALWRAGRRDEALSALRAELEPNDARALSVLSELWSGERPPADFTALYKLGARLMDDNTPARERGRLAMLCLADGDLQCAYVQGLRAALQGDAIAPKVLEVVAERHPDAHVRRSVTAWLKTFRTTPKQTDPTPPAAPFEPPSEPDSPDAHVAPG